MEINKKISCGYTSDIDISVDGISNILLKNNLSIFSGRIYEINWIS